MSAPSTDIPTSGDGGPPPHEIGGYVVERVLPGVPTIFATAPGGRPLVLKTLPPECLLEGQLHPSVRERLLRVRELAEKNVANLHGVERDGTYTFLVWDFVPGQSLADLDLPRLPFRALLLVARELVLTVESLHAAGIVHGAIKRGNVILDADEGRVRVTHVSPLLYTDPQRDADAVIDLLLGLLAGRRERDQTLGLILSQAKAQRLTLRQLGAQLADVRDPSEVAVRARARGTMRSRESKTRRRALWGALAVTILGVAASAGAWWYVNRLNDPYRLLGDNVSSPPSGPTTAPAAS